MNDIISVIIPSYNVEKYLDCCIESVVSQTYKNIEIILIDDGSVDNTALMCDAWSEKDSRIRVIHQNNQGLSAARNNGIKVATGKYICFVDSDDYIEADLFESCITSIKNNNSDIVVFGMNRVDENGKVFETEIPKTESVLSSYDALKLLFKGEIKDYAPNKLFKTELFNETEFPVDRNFEDIGTIYKLFLTSDKISLLTKALYNYRKRDGSIVSNMSDKALQDLFIMRKERYDFMNSLYPEIATLNFGYVALSAKRLIDRSLWNKVDRETLTQALEFIKVNKKEILKLKNYELIFFVRYTKVYKILRIVKHRIGKCIKSVLKK